MAENSKIQWTHHTFNPWRGCTKVSAGCANCYAETGSRRNQRVLGTWGPQGTRVVASESMWREPLRWNQAAAKAGERRRVFCASFADVFESWGGLMADSNGDTLFAKDEQWTAIADPDSAQPITMNDVRKRLFRLIDATPNLDWLLLTKRPENIAKMMPAYFPGGYIAEAGTMNQEGPRENVFLGTTVENQEAADERIPHLLNAPAAVRFLSVEPMLGPVDLRPKAPDTYSRLGVDYHSGIDSTKFPYANDRVLNCFPKIHWVICGGESGHDARPFVLGWAKDLRKQCLNASVPFFMKQIGANPTNREGLPHSINDKKGGDMSEWPEDLRVREFPKME